MTTNYEITIAKEEDIHDLIVFGKTEFTRTFGHLYAKEDLESYLGEGYSISRYEDWIRSDKYRILYARDQISREIVGYILSGKCGLPLDDCAEGPYDLARSGEIKRLYNHPSTFGTGLAQELTKTAIDCLKGIYQDCIFVGVCSENYRGIKFYEKMGFHKIGEYDFPVGNHVDREHIMTLLPSV